MSQTTEELTAQIEKGTAAGTYYFFTCPKCQAFNLLTRSLPHISHCKKCMKTVKLTGFEV